MSETLQYKIYKLGGAAYDAAAAYHKIKRQVSEHEPVLRPIVDQLGYFDGVSANHPRHGYSFIYPTTRLSPIGTPEFYMTCPIGLKDDGTIGHFIPKDSQEVDLGISQLVLHGGEMVFERDPIKLPPPEAKLTEPPALEP